MNKWAVIPLTSGYVSIVSQEDYDRVIKYKWYVHRSKGKRKKAGQPYARAMVDGKRMLLHRFILNPSDDLHVDHINFQTLDNRRENIRAVLPIENSTRKQINEIEDIN